jgi:N4-(beta-N-acetylglucosaminyl)-L-asparaginase
MPVVISSENGLRATEKAMQLIKGGADTLDAVIAGVNIVEEDPNDMTVGYGGLPNERGVVELDACVMHGPTYRAGAVASLQNIKTPSKVAKVIMERTNHLLLVGVGALEFAKAHGFKEENLLTDQARQKWLTWKENLAATDDWVGDEERKIGFERPTGTITCCALNERGELSGVTTTSGLAFKIPGRVGDSPIIGAGLYVDNEVGACGSTGKGEAVILSSGSRIVVENMRHGLGPEAAVLDVLKRICDRTVDRRLLHSRGKPKFNVNFYAINKKGEYAAGSIYKSTFTVHDGSKNMTKETAYLFEKEGG